jgi:hypothetical protein
MADFSAAVARRCSLFRLLTRGAITCWAMQRF